MPPNRRRKRMKSSNVENQTASPPWVELPVEITAEILYKLGALEMMMVAEKVCRQWRSLCRDPLTWRRIHFPDPVDDFDYRKATWRRINFPDPVDKLGADDIDYRKAYRHAIDRSQGQLMDVDIYYWYRKLADEFLPYMSQGCSQLKRLQLKHCFCITSDCLIQTMKGFPLLEEMHVYLCVFDVWGVNVIKVIGQSCPRLKSFTFDTYYDCKSKDIAKLDVDARAIAETMPQIRNLSVIGNALTREGLQAILDGCPRLESLDLRQCFNINFGGKIGELCEQRIKDLKRPHDSIKGYPFECELIEHSERNMGYYPFVCEYEMSSEDDTNYLSGFSDMDTEPDYADYLEFSDCNDYENYYDPFPGDW